MRLIKNRLIQKLYDFMGGKVNFSWVSKVIFIFFKLDHTFFMQIRDTKFQVKKYQAISNDWEDIETIILAFS